MRDAKFYFDLGFEHGYDCLGHSYPNRPSYERGYRTGMLFRQRVLKLVPTVERDDKGKFCGVRFSYIGWMKKKANSRKEPLTP